VIHALLGLADVFDGVPLAHGSKGEDNDDGDSASAKKGSTHERRSVPGSATTLAFESAEAESHKTAAESAEEHRDEGNHPRRLRRNCRFGCRRRTSICGRTRVCVTGSQRIHFV